MSASPPFTLRAAELRDVDAIVGLIRELAEFEQLTHLLQVTPQTLRPHLFGDKPVAEALVAEADARVVGFALFFTNFSTFLSRPGLYLEDLYVQPAQRGSGIGQALLARLGTIALQRGYGRFEWSVLAWNEPSLEFYASLGATQMRDWMVHRVIGPALGTLADRWPHPVGKP